MKLTAEQRVQKAHIWLMRSPQYCLYSGIIMIGKTRVVDDVPTACTNGRDTWYGRKFVEKLSDQELRGLILHENLHKAFRHLTTWRGIHKQNHRRANRACDYVINLMIYDSDPKGVEVALPEGGLLDERYRGMDAGTVFSMLMDEPDDSDGEAMDDHDWEGAEEMSDAEAQALGNEVEQALRQGKMLAGKLGANVPREVEEALESKVNWREALAEFVTSHATDKEESTWRRPNRRHVANDMYMPSMFSEAIGRVVIGIDTSGSICNDVLGQFLSEVRGICQTVQPEGIDLLYWGDTVVGHEKYDRDQIDAVLSSTRPVGGGGTDVREMFAYIAEQKLKPAAVVVLTDGETPWPDTLAHPTLFAILGNCVAPIGKSLKIA